MDVGKTVVRYTKEAAFKAAVYSARRNPLPQESTGEIESEV